MEPRKNYRRALSPIAFLSIIRSEPLSDHPDQIIKSCGGRYKKICCSRTAVNSLFEMSHACAG